MCMQHENALLRHRCSPMPYVPVYHDWQKLSKSDSTCVLSSSQAKGTKSTSFLTRKERSGFSTLGLRRWCTIWSPLLGCCSRCPLVNFMKKNEKITVTRGTFGKYVAWRHNALIKCYQIIHFLETRIQRLFGSLIFLRKGTWRAHAALARNE